MIASLQGILQETRADSIVVEIGGMGFEIQVDQRTLGSLPRPGVPVKVYTYLQVLDNDLKLFGFSKRDELDLFKILIGVSGIGARGAQNILAALPPREFFQAIASGDEKRLLTVAGIGKKTAQRLVFELKDKIAQQTGILAAASDKSGGLEEVLQAMEALGYQRSEVFPLLMELQNQGEFSARVEDNIKQVLRRKAAMMKK
ncbi:MAG: Holliday junction branch migration protein RuvA [Syntrophomonadaceae bacterium]